MGQEVHAPQKHKVIPSKHPQKRQTALGWKGWDGCCHRNAFTVIQIILTLLILLTQLKLNLGAPKILFSVTWDMLENKRCWSTMERANHLPALFPSSKINFVLLQKAQSRTPELPHSSDTFLLCKHRTALSTEQEQLELQTNGERAGWQFKWIFSSSHYIKPSKHEVFGAIKKLLLSTENKKNPCSLQAL